MEKAKKRWYKRWYMIVLYVFLGFMVIGALVGDDTTTTDSSNSDSASSSTAASLITRPLAEMLPTREEIDTEYKMSSPEDIAINATGFEEGKKLTADKIEGSVGYVGVDYTVYRFSDSASAKSYYDSAVQSVKSEGGYKEFSISSNCFGYEEDYGFQSQFGTGICYRNNIVYESYATVAQAFTSADRLAEDGAKLLSKKVK